ncbi:MAG: hypothetical protein RBR19_00870 [Sedimentisphaerales bacterium]|jgi:hypothetical protein|nr:hypothetical protein [Sedimentisphaerales bacterium]NLT75862.1 hypothetical protein [Planctomycetota bacterium]
MTTAQAIVEHLKALLESVQREVLDFVKSLESRQTDPSQDTEDAAWSQFSLASALRDMEDEKPPYTFGDTKGSFP